MAEEKRREKKVGRVSKEVMEKVPQVFSKDPQFENSLSSQYKAWVVQTIYNWSKMRLTRNMEVKQKKGLGFSDMKLRLP